MSQQQVKRYDSYEEFEREFLPRSHAERNTSNPWSMEHVASDMAADSLAVVSEALRTSSS